MNVGQPEVLLTLLATLPLFLKKGRRHTLIHPLIFLRGPTWNGLFLWVKFTCLRLKIRIVLDFLVNLGEAPVFLAQIHTNLGYFPFGFLKSTCLLSFPRKFLGIPKLSTDEIMILPLQWILCGIRWPVPNGVVIKLVMYPMCIPRKMLVRQCQKNHPQFHQKEK